jgi:hypothetical protein
MFQPMIPSAASTWRRRTSDPPLVTSFMPAIAWPRLR